MKRPPAHHVALVVSALSVVAYLAFWVQRAPRSPRQLDVAAAVAPAPRATTDVPRLPQPAQAASPSPPPVTTVAPPGEPNEAQLMAELRELRLTNPAETLLRAERANAAYPDSAAAAERAWLIVRSLEDLRRFHEARAQALAMRQRYPGTSWTADVERHVLVYPLDQPSREEQQAALRAGESAN
jgi:hypothetical protein